MKFSSFIVLSLFLTISASAQSGRRKPSPTPTPKAINGPSVNNVPPQPVTTTPTPKAADKIDPEDIIKVDSVLVPIPVSVLEREGRAVTNLKLADFELKIDGKAVEITDVARSDTPIRLAMLFDNSSSVLIARDFEKEAAVRFFRRVIRPEKDKAALFSVATATQLEQPLTSNVGALTRTIDLFPPIEDSFPEC